MKYEIQRTSRFKKDYKLALKRGYDSNKLMSIVIQLANGESLHLKTETIV